jgi:hypothetical protein
VTALSRRRCPGSLARADAEPEAGGCARRRLHATRHCELCGDVRTSAFVSPERTSGIAAKPRPKGCGPARLKGQAPDDEYDGYAGVLASKLNRGNERSHIASYLTTSLIEKDDCASSRERRCASFLDRAHVVPTHRLGAFSNSEASDAESRPGSGGRTLVQSDVRA